MRNQVDLTGDVTYDGNGNVIEVNGKKIAKGGASAQTKVAVKSRVLKAVKTAVSGSDYYNSDLREMEDGYFFRGQSNDYLIEVTAKKENDSPRAIMIASGGAVSEYAAGLLRMVVKTLKDMDGATVLWAENSKARVNFACGDFEVRVVKKRDRL